MCDICAMCDFKRNVIYVAYMFSLLRPTGKMVTLC